MSVGKKFAGGRPKVLSSRDQRRDLKLATNGNYLRKEILWMTGFNVCKEKICNTIPRSAYFQYTAKFSKILLVLCCD